MGEASEAAKSGARSIPCKFVLDGITACVDVSDPLMLGEEFHQPKDATGSEVDFIE